MIVPKGFGIVSFFAVYMGHVQEYLRHIVLGQNTQSFLVYMYFRIQNIVVLQPQISTITTRGRCLSRTIGVND